MTTNPKGVLAVWFGKFPNVNNVRYGSKAAVKVGKADIRRIADVARKIDCFWVAVSLRG